MEKLQKSLKPISLGEEYSEITNLLASSTDRILENIPDRNPLEEVDDWIEVNASILDTELDELQQSK